MTHVNSLPNEPQAHAKQTVLKQLKTLLLKFLRRSQGFLAAQTLPHLADKACKIYLGEAHQAHQARCRRILKSTLELDPIQLHRFFHTALGEMLLSWGERFFHLPDHSDDEARKQALKTLLLQMAADPEGLSLLSFMRRPDTLKFNLDQVLLTAKRVDLLVKETAATLDILRSLAASEAEASPNCDFSQWPDLRQPGPFDIVQYTLLLDRTGKPASAEVSQPLQVLCYQPQPWPTQPVPVVIQSHGLASSPEDLELYARHLTSHGYFVAAPWHSGSDVRQVRSMLEGKSHDIFKVQEFIDRPLDISYLLDQLEQRNETQFDSRLDLGAVGVMGYSFGAYTAFALAGASIHFESLEQACRFPWDNPNLSLLLQCQALGLPRQAYCLQDSRIRAIVSLDAVGSEVFGTHGMSDIQTPVLLLASSHDIAAPLVFEQVHLFERLTIPHRYLAVMQGKAHIRNLQRLTESLNLQVKVLPPRPAVFNEMPFDHYINALSLAFFGQHLMPDQIKSDQMGSDQKASLELTARYANTLSQDPYQLWLVSAQSSQALAEQLQGWMGEMGWKNESVGA